MDAKQDSFSPEERRRRAELNSDALEHLRERSQAPGVAGGGADRNHYCMHCNGVLPLEYDSRQPAEAGAPSEFCPHCGAEVDQRVRAMFNWVEMDQVPGSDLKVLLPGVLLLLGLLAAGLLFFLLG